MNRVFFMGMLFAGLGLTAFGDTFVFGVDSTPNHNYGSGSNTFTFGTSTFTAQEFNDTALFSKSGGGDENGLGVTGDPDHDNELYVKGRGTQDFIQLNVANLLTAGYTNFSFSMGSSTEDESWSVSACAVSGVDCGTAASTINGSNESSHSLTGILSATNHYLDFRATEGNVLIHSLSANAAPAVPEPGSIALLGTALLAVLGGRRINFRF